MKFLVPYDFTDVTRIALDHALALAPKFDASIELFHVVKSENDIPVAQELFENLLDTLPAEGKTRIESKIQVGSIFKDISKEADEGDAHLLVMGTHGAHGLQKLFGSHAVKVISSSNTPFMVTQEKGPEGAIKKIAMAVNLSKESVQIVKFAAELAKKFKAEIQLLCQPENDEFLAKQLSNNITRAKQYLQKQNVAYKVEMLRGTHSLSHEVIEYGKKNNSDLFAIVHFSESLIPQFDTFTQDMITNEWGIPVLTINGNEMTGVRIKYSFISI